MLKLYVLSIPPLFLVYTIIFAIMYHMFHAFEEFSAYFPTNIHSWSVYTTISPIINWGFIAQKWIKSRLRQP